MGLVPLGCIGGLLPDVIRLLNWAKDGATDPASVKRPPKAGVLLRLVGALIQVGLGGFAVYLLGAASPLQAVAIGFAGPEFLTRILAAAAPRVTPPSPGATPQAGMIEELPPARDSSAINAILDWWRS